MRVGILGLRGDKNHATYWTSTNICFNKKVNPFATSYPPWGKIPLVTHVTLMPTTSATWSTLLSLAQGAARNPSELHHQSHWTFSLTSQVEVKSRHGEAQDVNQGGSSKGSSRNFTFYLSQKFRADRYLHSLLTLKPQQLESVSTSSFWHSLTDEGQSWQTRNRCFLQLHLGQSAEQSGKFPKGERCRSSTRVLSPL